MIKFIIFTLFLKSALFAREVSQSVENSIMIEAALFVGIFGTMGIISYIYSSRHAKAYKKPEVVTQESVEKTDVEDRISELTEMLNSGVLTKEEYELLSKRHLQN
ncbi:MAG: hypothetical protein ABFQ64_00040 [Campylobacterota bacterium]